jgi:glycosyltransferase involved in cell wall biosynthesis
MTRHVGIYNRYWNSFGGGEKHIGAIAEVLSSFKGVDVSLIGIEPFSPAALGERLSLDLSRCRTTIWPDIYEEQTQLTAGYDLFVNSTYFSPLPSLARRSAYMCFFPGLLDRPAGPAPVERFFRRWPGAGALRASPPAGGFIALGGYRGVDDQSRCWFGPNAAFRVDTSRANPWWLRLPVEPGAGGRIRRVTVNRIPCTWTLDGGSLRLDLPPSVLLSRPAAVDVFVDFAPESGLAASASDQAGRGALAVDLRRCGPPHAAPSEPAASWLESYDAVIANSNYTAGWIRKRWDMPSVTLPPPIDLAAFAPGDASRPREPVILSVGRFFAGGHNKKHDVMIAAFKRMIDRRELPAGWRLVLAGSRHQETQAHRDYYESLRTMAAGYPIEFEPDIPRPELIRLYQTASLYWHAAGFGECEVSAPELFEHFGITTCEAMACGLIPVVIARAGQREIVMDGVTGYTFTTTEEFVTKTLRAISTVHTPAGDLLRKAARQSLDRYSTAAFRRSTERIFRPLL